jgi:hypothetical protein
MAYILNLTNTILSVGKYAEIKPGKYLHADAYILESEETAYALRARWASLHDEVPAEISFGDGGQTFEVSPSAGTSEYPGEAKPIVPAVSEPAPAPEAEPEAVVEAKEVEEAPATKKANKAKAAPTAE